MPGPRAQSLKIMQRLLLACLLSAAGASPPAAQDLPAEQAGDYADCMAEARDAPDTAFERAQTWADLGGGAPARHCAAVALIGLGQFEEAAQSLEDLALDLRSDDSALRADLLAQAGQAWLLAGKPERAYGAQTTALELTPEDPDLWIDRSLALAAAQNYWEAIDDLNRAAELGPPRADLLIFRASAYRYVDAPELAMEDVERALRLDPDNLEGLLERGNLRRVAGDEGGARNDWLRILEIAPDSPAAAAARRNLEKLDVAVE